MKHFQSVIWGLWLTGLLFSQSALADHIAIVYCAVDANNDVRVVAADANPSGEASTSAKRGRPCSQTLHEIMASGYEMSHTEAVNAMTPAANQRGERGYMVFVLKKPAPHK